MIRTCLLSVFTLVISFVPIQGCAAVNTKNVVRVAVLKDVRNFDLSVRGRYRIIDLETQEEIDQGRQMSRRTVSGAADGIVIDKHEYGTRRLRLIAQKDSTVYHEDKARRYRDRIDILMTKDDKLLVVNALDLESYVKGVLYHEMPHRWPMNAIKAQAVATRTYALYQTNENKAKDYDVVSTIYSQVYGGRSAERYRTNLATNRTRGEVLMYKGKIFSAFFHANCGGHTEDASELWKIDLPPLKGVKCGFCDGQPHFHWKKNFQSKAVQETLNANGFSVGLIKEIAVQERNRSGRIENLKITTRDGKTAMISGIKFREIIGPNVLKSNKYKIEMKGYYFDVIGSGWGHGVGMCQWGAYQMAKQHNKYTRILQHYYPGATVETLSER